MAPKSKASRPKGPGPGKVTVPRKVLTGYQAQRRAARTKALKEQHKAIEKKHRGVRPALRRAGASVSETVGGYGTAAKNVGRDLGRIFAGKHVRSN